MASVSRDPQRDSAGVPVLEGDRIPDTGAQKERIPPRTFDVSMPFSVIRTVPVTAHVTVSKNVSTVTAARNVNVQSVNAPDTQTALVSGTPKHIGTPKHAQTSSHMQTPKCIGTPKHTGTPNKFYETD
jgi:hypothetical protein